MLANPFTFGKPVKDERFFVGRRTEIQQVVNRLLSSAHESTSVIGERRMGKTSLLLHLSNGQVAARYGITSDEYSLIYLDLQGATDILPQRFWQRVLTRLQSNANDPIISQAAQNLLGQSSFDIFDLDDLFETIAAQGRQVILFLDEFESITQNPNFKADFFGGLRSIAISKPLTIVTSTQSDLEALCHSDEIKSSPFFNIFATVVLRPFEDDDIEALIDQTLADCPVSFTKADRALVRSLGGGYPFFLQIAGYALFEGKRNGLSHNELYNEAIRYFDQQADPHFSYLWSECSDSQKITLLVVHLLSLENRRDPTAEEITETYNRAAVDLKPLLRRGLIISREQGYNLFSSRLGCWISAEIKSDPGDGQDGPSLSEWIQRGNYQELTQATTFFENFKKKYWPMLSVCLEQLSLGVARNILYQLLLERLVHTIS